MGVLEKFFGAKQRNISEESLFERIEKGDLDGVLGALNAGANPDTRNKKGETPLLAAIVADKVEIVCILLDHNANADAANRDGITPLMLAASDGNHAVMQLLISKGCDVNKRIGNGGTALVMAIMNGDDLDGVNLLLSNGAVTNYHMSEKGNTPLMAAAARGSLRVVQALLDAGADPQVKRRDGATAGGFAGGRDKHEIGGLLLVHQFKGRGQDSIEAVMRSFLESLRNNQAGMRAQAAAALGFLGDSRAIVPLTECLADQNVEVREIAERAIKRIKEGEGFGANSPKEPYAR